MKKKILTLEEKIIKFPVDCYTMVTGWFVTKTAMNPGKKQEHADRVNFAVQEDDL